MDTNVKVMVVGDVHGQYFDLLNILKRWRPDRNLLFLGDYVGEAIQSSANQPDRFTRSPRQLLKWPVRRRCYRTITCHMQQFQNAVTRYFLFDLVPRCCLSVLPCCLSACRSVCLSVA